MDKSAKVYVAGHRGLVGSAIVRALEREGYRNIICRTSSELDLRQQSAVNDFWATEKPEFVFLAAAKVGGILANSSYPADFIYDNLAIETNIIHAAHRFQAKKLLFLGSSCIYPKFAPQPMKEECLLGGELEETNRAYAVAKIAGIELCRSFRRQYGDNFIAAMPTNLYGPNDNFDLNSSHVLPALIRKMHEAKAASSPTVVVWGTGSPIREFLHVDDLADACLFLMANYQGGDIVNVGCGQGVTIKELALLIQDVVGYRGEIVFDTDKPDGTPIKIVDTGKINALGWQPKIGLRQGIASVYQWYLENNAK